MIFGNKERILYGNRFNGTNGNGYQPIKKEQTNEEWFDDLSTEEKAEFLSKIEEQYPCGSLLKCDVTCGYHSQCRGDDVAPTNKEAWVEWLKQPHKPIS